MHDVVSREDLSCAASNSPATTTEKRVTRNTGGGRAIGLLPGRGDGAATIECENRVGVGGCRIGAGEGETRDEARNLRRSGVVVAWFTSPIYLSLRPLLLRTPWRFSA
jgi:hypothetical protein